MMMCVCMCDTRSTTKRRATRATERNTRDNPTRDTHHTKRIVIIIIIAIVIVIIILGETTKHPRHISNFQYKNSKNDTIKLEEN